MPQSAMEAYVTRVEIALPVHNEEHSLEANVRWLVAFLTTSLPGADASVAIADNGSTGNTPQIAARLTSELPRHGPTIPPCIGTALWKYVLRALGSCTTRHATSQQKRGNAILPRHPRRQIIGARRRHICCQTPHSQ